MTLVRLTSGRAAAVREVASLAANHAGGAPAERHAVTPQSIM